MKACILVPEIMSADLIRAICEIDEAASEALDEKVDHHKSAAYAFRDVLK